MLLTIILCGIVICALVVWLVCVMRRSCRVEAANQLFCMTLSSVYEQVCEMNLTKKEFYQYFILNGMLEKTKMHEALDQYLPRLVRERVFQKDTESVRAALLRDNLLRLSQTGGTQYIEYRRLSPKGTPYWCSLLLQGVAPGKRQDALVMGYITDIDEVKGGEEKSRKRLVEALRNAEHLSEIKGNFTSRVSHEIRTPLNAIIGYLAIANVHKNESERVLDCLTKIDTASKHLLSLINDILDVSAMESGKMRLDERTFKLRDFIRDLGSLFFGQANEAGLHFDVKLNDITEDTLLGDDMRIRQILMNLISNAFKFTPKGGCVEMAVTQKAIINDVVHLSFMIRDNGIGMHPEFMSHIFEQFEQEESATARKYGGSGLGLSIVKNLTEIMSGTISVQSIVGQGSTFTVNIPLRRVKCELPQGSLRRAITKLHVLVAADDLSALEIISLLMNRLDMTYDSAVSGSIVIEKARQAMDKSSPYQLCILDWDINGMESREICRQLRQIQKSGLRIAALTSHNTLAIQAGASELGVDVVLQKPLNISLLVDLLTECASCPENKDAAAEHRADFTGSRVLLVEDNRMNREIGRELLINVNVTVDTAENGQIGVDMFTKQPAGTYQMVLMDIQMPVMDGFTAAKQIRASDKADAKSIPILALTANAYPSDVSQSLVAGMNAHISKPIDPDALYAMLRDYLIVRAPVKEKEAVYESAK